MSRSPVVLGIDPGSHVTGWGVITQEGTRLIHKAHGSIRATREHSLESRLQSIHAGIVEVIQKHSPRVMAIESVFYAKNVSSAVALAHARGVALLAAAQLELAVAEYSPLEVKRATVGYGRATKEQVSQMISHLFRISPPKKKALDASDALAVALCHLNVYQTASKIRESETTRPQLITETS